MQQTLNQAVKPAPAGTCATYERRRPEETVLYQLVQVTGNCSCVATCTIIHVGNGLISHRYPDFIRFKSRADDPLWSPLARHPKIRHIYWYGGRSQVPKEAFSDQ